MRVALDGDARRKQLACVACVLRTDARQNRLRALEALAGIERLTLGARAQVGTAALATRVGDDVISKDVRASRAPHHLVESRHTRCAPFKRLALGFIGACFDAIRRRPRRLRTRRPAPGWPPFARCILIAPLPILSIRHASLLALGCGPWTLGLA